MSKNYLNVWNWKHPVRSIKNAYWRITKGFCPEDTWDWYIYEANLIHDSLMYLADNHVGIMYEYENDDEGYTNKLISIANTIYNATYYEDTYDNPFREDYYKDLENVSFERTNENGMRINRLNFDKTSKALFDHFQFVEQRNGEKAKKNLKEAFDWIAEHWFELWD